VKTTGATLAGTVLTSPISSYAAPPEAARKTRLVMVGTGSRGAGMWGKSVVEEHGEHVEFVGLCDINPGRVEWARRYIGADCPVFTDFAQMIRRTRPDTVIVTTDDASHHTFIIQGLEMGCDIIAEKPMTTDERKCQAILDAERRSGKNVRLTFNNRYRPHKLKLKQLLMQERIGKVTSAEYYEYLDVYHGADYFRRWHRLREMSGTLLVHKSTHHFDVMNWWLDSEPVEVVAQGALDHYGANNEFRHSHCRPCPHKQKCDFYWDITQNPRMMEMYVANEKYDGYLRDGCVWRRDIDIYDTHTALIEYANGARLSYTLTTYSPYEGERIAFNGTKGRIEISANVRQPWPLPEHDEIRITDNFGGTEIVRVPREGGEHGGADVRLRRHMFAPGQDADPFNQVAGTRDGAMSILTGIAADQSIQTRAPVRIADLTDLVPQAKRPV
jgi:predicted dehydrogenase